MGNDGAVPLYVLAKRLHRSARTLKRWHAAGWLPLLVLPGGPAVPTSFLVMLFASPQPKRPGVLKDVAKRWYAGERPPASLKMLEVA